MAFSGTVSPWIPKVGRKLLSRICPWMNLMKDLPTPLLHTQRHFTERATCNRSCYMSILAFANNFRWERLENMSLFASDPLSLFISSSFANDTRSTLNGDSPMLACTNYNNYSNASIHSIAIGWVAETSTAAICSNAEASNIGSTCEFYRETQ